MSQHLGGDVAAGQQHNDRPARLENLGEQGGHADRRRALDQHVLVRRGRLDDGVLCRRQQAGPVDRVPGVESRRVALGEARQLAPRPVESVGARRVGSGLELVIR